MEVEPADRIVDACVKCYNEKVRSKGKPQKGKEWTLLAAVVLEKIGCKENDSKFFVW